MGDASTISPDAAPKTIQKTSRRAFLGVLTGALALIGLGGARSVSAAPEISGPPQYDDDGELTKGQPLTQVMTETEAQPQPDQQPIPLSQGGPK